MWKLIELDAVIKVFEFMREEDADNHWVIRTWIESINRLPQIDIVSEIEKMIENAKIIDEEWDDNISEIVRRAVVWTLQELLQKFKS